MPVLAQVTKVDDKKMTENGRDLSQLAQALNMSKYTSAKGAGSDKETVGAVQMQFLEDLMKAQGKVQGVDELTQGQDILSL